MATKTQTERNEAIDNLREWLKPGDTVYTILRHVSRSGMSRDISIVVIRDGATLHPIYYNYSVARALGLRLVTTHGLDAVRVGGGGMDMGFSIVYDLGRTLFQGNYICTGKDCSSNDHNNKPYPDRDGVMQHSDAGYSLNHRWL